MKFNKYKKILLTSVSSVLFATGVIFSSIFVSVNYKDNLHNDVNSINYFDPKATSDCDNSIITTPKKIVSNSKESDIFNWLQYTIRTIPTTDGIYTGIDLSSTSSSDYGRFTKGIRFEDDGRITNVRGINNQGGEPQNSFEWSGFLNASNNNKTNLLNGPGVYADSFQNATVQSRSVANNVQIDAIYPNYGTGEERNRNQTRSSWPADTGIGNSYDRTLNLITENGNRISPGNSFTFARNSDGTYPSLIPFYMTRWGIQSDNGNGFGTRMYQHYPNNVSIIIHNKKSSNQLLFSDGNNLSSESYFTAWANNRYTTNTINPETSNYNEALNKWTGAWIEERHLYKNFAVNHSREQWQEFGNLRTATKWIRSISVPLYYDNINKQWSVLFDEFLYDSDESLDDGDISLTISSKNSTNIGTVWPSDVYKDPAKYVNMFDLEFYPNARKHTTPLNFFKDNYKIQIIKADNQKGTLTFRINAPIFKKNTRELNILTDQGWLGLNNGFNYTLEHTTDYHDVVISGFKNGQTTFTNNNFSFTDTFNRLYNSSLAPVMSTITQRYFDDQFQRQFVADIEKYVNKNCFLNLTNNDIVINSRRTTDLQEGKLNLEIGLRKYINSNLDLVTDNTGTQFTKNYAVDMYRINGRTEINQSLIKLDNSETQLKNLIPSKVTSAQIKNFLIKAQKQGSQKAFNSGWNNSAKAYNDTTGEIFANLGNIHDESILSIDQLYPDDKNGVLNVQFTLDNIYDTSSSNTNFINEKLSGILVINGFNNVANPVFNYTTSSISAYVRNSGYSGVLNMTNGKYGFTSFGSSFNKNPSNYPPKQNGDNLLLAHLYANYIDGPLEFTETPNEDGNNIIYLPLGGDHKPVTLVNKYKSNVALRRLIAVSNIESNSAILNNGFVSYVQGVNSYRVSKRNNIVAPNVYQDYIYYYNPAISETAIGRIDPVSLNLNSSSFIVSANATSTGTDFNTSTTLTLLLADNFGLRTQSFPLNINFVNDQYDIKLSLGNTSKSSISYHYPVQVDLSLLYNPTTFYVDPKRQNSTISLIYADMAFTNPNKDMYIAMIDPSRAGNVTVYSDIIGPNGDIDLNQNTINNISFSQNGKYLNFTSQINNQPFFVNIDLLNLSTNLGKNTRKINLFNDARVIKTNNFNDWAIAFNSNSFDFIKVTNSTTEPVRYIGTKPTQETVKVNANSFSQYTFDKDIISKISEQDLKQFVLNNNLFQDLTLINQATFDPNRFSINNIEKNYANGSISFSAYIDKQALVNFDLVGGVSFAFELQGFISNPNATSLALKNPDEFANDTKDLTITKLRELYANKQLNTIIDVINPVSTDVSSIDGLLSYGNNFDKDFLVESETQIDDTHAWLKVKFNLANAFIGTNQNIAAQNYFVALDIKVKTSDLAFNQTYSLNDLGLNSEANNSPAVYTDIILAQPMKMDQLRDALHAKYAMPSIAKSDIIISRFVQFNNSRGEIYLTVAIPTLAQNDSRYNDIKVSISGFNNLGGATSIERQTNYPTNIAPSKLQSYFNEDINLLSSKALKYVYFSNPRNDTKIVAVNVIATDDLAGTATVIFSAENFFPSSDNVSNVLPGQWLNTPIEFTNLKGSTSSTLTNINSFDANLANNYASEITNDQFINLLITTPNALISPAPNTNITVDSVVASNKNGSAFVKFQLDKYVDLDNNVVNEPISFSATISGFKSITQATTFAPKTNLPEYTYDELNAALNNNDINAMNALMNSFVEITNGIDNARYLETKIVKNVPQSTNSMIVYAILDRAYIANNNDFIIAPLEVYVTINKITNNLYYISEVKTNDPFNKTIISQFVINQNKPKNASNIWLIPLTVLLTVLLLFNLMVLTYWISNKKNSSDNN